MRLLPTKNTYRSFVAIALLPAIGLPILFWLSALLNAGSFAFATLLVFVFPPFLVAEALGIRNQSCGGTYGNALFEGYIGIGPKFPLGFIFCTAVWLAIGYIAWLLTFGIRTKK
jgi:hypothetical protein